MARRLHYGTRLPSGKPKAGTCISYNMHDPQKEIKPFVPEARTPEQTVEVDDEGKFYIKDSRLR